MTNDSTTATDAQPDNIDPDADRDSEAAPDADDGAASLIGGDDARTVETIEDAAHIPDEDFADPESDDWTLGQFRVGAIRLNDELFKLEEPESDDDIGRLIAATSDAGLLFERTVEVLLTKPDIETATLRERMTAKERMLFSEKALDWFGIAEFVDQEEVQAALAEQLKAERERSEASDE